MVHRLEEALALFKQEKYQEAINRCQEVTLHEPDNTNALMIIGKSNFSLEKWEECEKAYLRVTQLKPGFPAAWRALSDLYNKQENWVKRVDSLQVLCSILKSTGKIKAAQKLTLELAQSAVKAHILSTAFDAFYSLLHREDKVFSLLHVPNYDIISPVRIWLQLIDLLQHPTLNLEKCADSSLSRTKIAREFIRAVGEYGSWEYDSERLKVTELDLSDSEVEQTSKSITFCLSALINDLKKGSNLEKNILKTELDGLVFRVLEWFPIATLALEYVLCRTEDKDAVSMWNDTSDLTCRLVAINSNSPFSLMTHALQQFEEQKFSSARQTLMSAIRQNGSCLLGPCLRMYTLLAWIYVEEQNSDQILAVLGEIPSVITKKLEGFGTSPHLSVYSDTIEKFLMAKAYAFAGNNDSALILYRKVSEAINDNLAISAGICVSEIYLQQNSTKALPFIDQMISRSANASHSSQALLHCQHAWCLTYLDQNDVARVEFESHVCALDKKDQGLALKRLGTVYWKLGGEYRVNKSYSLTCFLQAARLKVDDEAFSYIGKWYLEVQKDSVRAEKCFLRALELSPRNEMAGKALSALYNSTERQHLNVTLWEALTKERELAPLWALLCLAQYHVNQDDERAVDVMLIALGRDPDNATHYVSLAHLYQHFGKYVSAQKTYFRAMELGADAWCLRCELARIEAMFQLFDDALSRLEPLLARTLPESVLAQTPEQCGIVSLHLADILYVQSKAFQAQGRYGDAVSNVIRASKVLRDSPETQMTRLPILRLLAEIHASAFYLSPKAFDVQTGQSDAWLPFISQARHACDLGIKLMETCDSKQLMVDMHLLIATGCWYEAAALCCRSGVSNQAFGSYPINCPSELLSKVTELKTTSWRHFIKALEMDPKNAFAWNGIGIVHGNLIVKQFCWIRAIQCTFLDAAWANLGFLYAHTLYNRQKQTLLLLAKEVFLKLQDVNSDHTGMWLGYGFLHQLEKSDQAADLSIQAFACALSLDFDLDALLGVAFSLLHSANDVEIENGLGIRLAEVVFYLHKYLERDPFNAIAWNTLGVALYYSELYRQSAKAFTTAKELLSSDSHAEWISQIDGNQMAAMILAGNYVQQNRQKRFEMADLVETLPEKAIECLKQHRSLFCNASCLGMATVLVLARAKREDEAFRGLKGLLEAADNGGISSRACRHLLGITGLSVVFDRIPAFGDLAIEMGRQSKRQIEFWSDSVTALWEHFEAAAYVFERETLPWTDLPTNSRVSALIALAAFDQNHVDAFDVAKQIRADHTLPGRYVSVMITLLSSSFDGSLSSSLKLLRENPTSAMAYLYTTYALVKKDAPYSTLNKLLTRGKSYAKTAEMMFEFDMLAQVVATRKCSESEIDVNGKYDTNDQSFLFGWQCIRLVSMREPKQAIDMYHKQCGCTQWNPRQLATLVIELASAYESVGRIDAAISIWKCLLQNISSLNIVQPENLSSACNLRLAFLYGVRLCKPKAAKGYFKAVNDIAHHHIIESIQSQMNG